MNVEDDIAAYIGSQPQAKRRDLQALHLLIRSLMPEGRLWFLDGRNAEGKTVSNPNIGYGECLMTYANGVTRPFYRIGLSANTSGISVYIMGLKDKNHLKATYASTIGKASVTGYCIKFKKVSDIDLQVLKAVVKDGFKAR